MDSLLTLGLSSVGLQSLDGFPTMPQLSRLSLADNKITTSSLAALVQAGLPKLAKLDLAGNKISKVEDLAPLKALASLRALEVLGCPLAAGNYRTELFALLPQLQAVDNKNAAGVDVCVPALACRASTATPSCCAQRRLSLVRKH